MSQPFLTFGMVFGPFVGLGLNMFSTLLDITWVSQKMLGLVGLSLVPYASVFRYDPLRLPSKTGLSPIQMGPLRQSSNHDPLAHEIS